MANYEVGYNLATVTIASTTVPVSIIPPGFMAGGWGIKARLANTPNVLIFPYTGALPNSAPANAWELGPGQIFNDNITGSQSGQDNGIGSGWAGVLESAGSAVLDAVWR